MYYIYHIPGVKIGCSKKPDNRVKKQGYTEYEILEEYMDKDVAAEREIELQKQYGYMVDKVKYNQYDYEKNGKIGGKITGMKNVESGQIYKISTKESVVKGISSAIEVTSTPISVYRKDTGEYVGTYPSQSECARQLILNLGNLNSCLRGMTRHKSVGGYTFKYEPKP